MRFVTSIWTWKNNTQLFHLKSKHTCSNYSTELLQYVEGGRGKEKEERRKEKR